MSVVGDGAVKIGAWLVIPEALTLKKGGEEASLRLKAMSLLLYLASRPGDVISRDELIAQVWPETSATDDTLNSTIAQLRKILVADEEVDRYIVTVPKKGYRLAAVVAPVSGPLNAAFAENVLTKRATPSRIALIVAWPSVVIFIVLVIWWAGEKKQADELSSVPRFDARLVASDSAAEVFPSLSHSNEEVVYVRADLDTAQGDIVVKNLLTDHERILNTQPGIYGNPVWSPNDKLIAYLSFTGLNCSVKIVNSGGGPSRNVAPCSAILAGTMRPSLDWLPSGETIIAPQRVAGTDMPALFIVDVESGESSQFSFPPQGVVGDANQKVSPDGSKVAFTRTSTGGDAVGWIDMLTGKETMYPQLLSTVRGLDWSAHNSLLIASDKSGRSEVWRFDIDTGESGWLGIGGHDVSHLDYDMITGSMVLSELETDNNISVRGLADKPIVKSKAEPIFRIDSTADEKTLALSSDGAQLVYTRVFGARTELWVSQLNSNAPDSKQEGRRLLNLENSEIHSLNWSSKNDQLVMEVLKGTVSSIYVYQFSNEHFYRLQTPESVNTYSPVWSADDKDIFYSTHTGSSWPVWRYSLSEQQASTLLSDAGNQLQFDDDHGRLLYSRYAQPGLWAISLDSGFSSDQSPVVEKIVHTPGILFRDWYYESGSVYFTRLSEAISNTIYRQSLVEGTIENYFISNYSISHFDKRGRVLAASEIESPTADVYLYSKYVEE